MQIAVLDIIQNIVYCQIKLRERIIIIKEIIWMGDSLRQIKSFPDNPRQDLGYSLRRLQDGKLPLSSRPMQSIGPGVFELKTQDKAVWYRVVYTARFNDKIYVLHSFIKKSAKTSKNDLEVALQRFKQIKV